MAATSPAGELNSSSSMTVGINISPSSLYTSNAFVHLYDRQHNQQNLPRHQQRSSYHRPQHFHLPWHIHTSAEDQSLGLEDRGTAGKILRTTGKNCRSQRKHRWVLYTNVRDAEGTDIWSTSVARHGGLRGTAQLVESTVLPIVSALRHADPSPCSRIPTWSLRLVTAVARRKRSGAPFPGRRRSGRGGHCSRSSSILRGRTRRPVRLS